MKHTQYDVTYMNGNKEIFYCNDICSAYYACYFADSKGWDNQIDTITDEYGTIYGNFRLEFDNINKRSLPSLFRLY